MGHRALIAYERPDSLYNCHYSHWGACNLRLKRDITPERPFGGDRDNEAARCLFDALAEATTDETVNRVLKETAAPQSQVDQHPLVIGTTIETIITEHLDYLHHEAFYVVDAEFEITAYRTHWFGLQYDSRTIEHAPTVGNGALRTVRWYDGEPVGDGFAQGEFRALKAVVGEMVDQGVFSPAEAVEYMCKKLDAWAGTRDEILVRTPVER
ncbi:hypothetical protein EGH21_22725 [Halomicroarcula sp. F13]|uniref:Uncharacterized protein n=1 Tax=Haloarcula rubra TaxID=2487747 RepID=A0AAW4PXD3_9EURY|nr:hypothetical protein [Halomicroarcula rubra]